MTRAPLLLDDEAMQDFIVSGIMLVPSSLPKEFHDRIVARLDEANQGQPNPRSGIVDAVPELREVYTDPVVQGALHSLLGSDMRMHYYTSSHCNPPGAGGQLWHRDSAHDRPEFPWRLTVFYFPRPVTSEMGATVVVPGTQYRRVSNTDLHRYGHFCNQVAIEVSAASLLIMHYDLWHRGTTNRVDRTRYMVKAVFERTSAPRRPSWNAAPGSDSPASLRRFRQLRVALDNETEMYLHQEQWVRTWQWFHGSLRERDDWFPSYLP